MARNSGTPPYLLKHRPRSRPTDEHVAIRHDITIDPLVRGATALTGFLRPAHRPPMTKDGERGKPVSEIISRKLRSRTRLARLAVGAGLAACLATPAFAVTTDFAVVRQDGVVTRSSGPMVVEKTDKGTYAVVFADVLDVSRCAFVATIGTGNEYQPSPGFITVMEHPLQDVDPQFRRFLFVQTRAPSKAFDDRPFHLVMTCK